MQAASRAGIDASCPRCNTPLPTEGHCCSSCGFTLFDLRLYSPKHFVWMAFLLSALPDTTGHPGYLIGYVINLPIASLLRAQQRPIYRAGLRLGARPASQLKGVAIGLIFVVGAMSPTFIGAIAKYHVALHQAESLFDQDKFDEAAAIFQRLLDEDPEDSYCPLQPCVVSRLPRTLYRCRMGIGTVPGAEWPGCRSIRILRRHASHARTRGRGGQPGTDRFQHRSYDARQDLWTRCR